MAGPLPSLHLVNRQRSVAFDRTRLAAIVHHALPDCVAATKSPSEPLATLTEIVATLVSDKVIAKVHADFLNDPTATDVITFPYGEIVLGSQTIAANAEAARHSPTDEAALCIIHGLLHLAGWNDHTPLEAKAMHQEQDRIWNSARRLV